MLDLVRQRAIEVLRLPRKAAFATSGPAGLHVSEVPCEAQGLSLYLLVPHTSDHLFNLEHGPAVTLWTPDWELNGQARVMPASAAGLALELLKAPGAKWCTLIQVDPCRIQIGREGSWVNLETIDLQPGPSPE